MNQFTERPQYYQLRFKNSALTAGFQQLGVELKTDSDAPFRMTGIALYVFDAANVALAAAGNIKLTVRFARPDGSWVQKHLSSAQAINPFDAGAVTGAGLFQAPYFGYFSPLATNILYPAGSSIQFDFADLAAQTTGTVLAVCIGTKLFDPAAIWQPPYPAKYTARPYFGYNVQFDPSQLPIKDLPFNVAPDADFVWQYGAQTDQPPAGQLFPVGAFRGLGIRVRDWTGKYYMNDFIPIELLFGFDNSQTPGLIYPEIYIPKNQALYLDLVQLP